MAAAKPAPVSRLVIFILLSLGVHVVLLLGTSVPYIMEHYLGMGGEATATDGDAAEHYEAEGQGPATGDDAGTSPTTTNPGGQLPERPANTEPDRSNDYMDQVHGAGDGDTSEPAADPDAAGDLLDALE